MTAAERPSRRQLVAGVLCLTGGLTFAVIVLSSPSWGQTPTLAPLLGIVGSAVAMSVGLAIAIWNVAGRAGRVAAVLAVIGSSFLFSNWPFPIIALVTMLIATPLAAFLGWRRGGRPRWAWILLLLGAAITLVTFVGGVASAASGIRFNETTVAVLVVGLLAALGIGHVAFGFGHLAAGGARARIAGVAMVGVGLVATALVLLVAYDVVRLPGRVAKLPIRTAPLAPMAVVIDTDMVADDWMAILYLLSEPQVDVRAITVAGTAPMGCDEGLDLARRLAAVAGAPDTPVACGRAQPLGGGHFFPSDFAQSSRALAASLDLPEAPGGPATTDAVSLLREVVATGEPLTIVSLGPPTNIAQLIESDPDLARSGISRIVQMGGALDVSGNVSPNNIAEWNVYVDPRATQIVFRSGLPVTMVGLDATNNVPVTPAVIDRFIANATTPAARTAAAILDGQRDFASSGFMFAWDQLAATIAREPALALGRETPVDVTQDGVETGRTVTATDGPIVLVAIDADRPGFERTIIEALNGRMP
jgi:pyrimidine-specific ribonucleoside hydrolase